MSFSSYTYNTAGLEIVTDIFASGGMSLKRAAKGMFRIQNPAANEVDHPHRLSRTQACAHLFLSETERYYRSGLGGRSSGTFPVAITGNGA